MSESMSLLFSQIGFAVVCVIYVGYKIYQKWFAKEITIETLNEDCDALQEKLMNDFDLTSYARWDFDQETSQLTFYDENDCAKVVADCQILGTYVKGNSSWLFSWANPSILVKCKEQLEFLRELLAEAWGQVIEEELDASEEGFDFHQMIPMAMNTLEAKGWFRAESEKTDTYLILTDVQWAPAVHH